MALSPLLHCHHSRLLLRRCKRNQRFLKGRFLFHAFSSPSLSFLAELKFALMRVRCSAEAAPTPCEFDRRIGIIKSEWSALCALPYIFGQDYVKIGAFWACQEYPDGLPGCQSFSPRFA